MVHVDNIPAWVTLVLLPLWTWRLSYMLVREWGPFEILTKLRDFFRAHEWQLLTCIYCTSIWIALVGLLGTYFAYDVMRWWIWWFALSTLAILIDRKGNM